MRVPRPPDPAAAPPDRGQPPRCARARSRSRRAAEAPPDTDAPAAPPRRRRRSRTGEEDEDEKFCAKAKLYRFDDGEWKERGVGPLKVLQHKENQMMRILMRTEKTLKIRANHLVAPGTNLSPHMDSEKCFVWSAMDYADEEPKAEMFCIRFGSVEKASAFKEAVDEAERVNTEIMAKQEGAKAEGEEGAGEEGAGEEKAADAEAADALAEQLESTAKVE